METSNEQNYQYIITRADPYVKEWVITDTENNEKYNIQFPAPDHELLKDARGENIGAVRSSGRLRIKKKFTFTREKCFADVEWQGKLTSNSKSAKGITTAQGFEQINWKFNMNNVAYRLDITDSTTNETVSKFYHNFKDYEEVGKLEILKRGMPKDMMLFVAYLTGYTFRCYLDELPQIGWDMAKKC
jgi:hypothetical protein